MHVSAVSPYHVPTKRAWSSGSTAAAVAVAKTAVVGVTAARAPRFCNLRLQGPVLHTAWWHILLKTTWKAGFMTGAGWQRCVYVPAASKILLAVSLETLCSRGCCSRVNLGVCCPVMLYVTRMSCCPNHVQPHSLGQQQQGTRVTQPHEAPGTCGCRACHASAAVMPLTIWF
jgi:hypothetical protein